MTSLIGGAIGLGLALPTGLLFGVGYGTGVRIGYEQIYPALFNKGEHADPTQIKDQIKSMYSFSDVVGGKEAIKMGIATGLANARQEADTNPDFRYFAELESKQFGLTQSRSRSSQVSETIEPSTPSVSSEERFDAKNHIISTIWNIKDVRELLVYRERYSHDSNILQVIRSRFAQLREQVPEKYRHLEIHELNQQMLDERTPATPTPAPTREAKPEEIELQKYIKRRTEDQKNLILRKQQYQFQLQSNPNLSYARKLDYQNAIKNARERIKRNVYDGTRWTGPNQWQARTQAITDKNNRIWNQ